MRQIAAQFSVFDREQRAPVARRDFAFFDPIEQRLFERKQADRIRNGGAVLPCSGSHFILREVKFLHQAVECARLLDGIEIFALDVFYERELERLLIAYFAQYGRHAQKLRALRGAPSPLSRDELVSRADLSHDQRLNDSAGANGLRQFFERRFRKSRPRLVRAGIDQVDVDLQRAAGGNLRGSGCRRGFLWMWLAGRPEELTSGSRIRAPSPLPNAFLAIRDDLLCKVDVGFRASTMNVVEVDRLPMARRFGQANVPRDNGLKDLAAKEAAKIRGHLFR